MIIDKLDFGLTNRCRLFYFCYENDHWLQKDDSQVHWGSQQNRESYDFVDNSMKLDKDVSAAFMKYSMI